MHELRASFSVSPEKMERSLRQRLERIIELATARIGQRKFEFQGKTGALSAQLNVVRYHAEQNLLSGRLAGPELWAIGSVPLRDLTDGQRRLFDSVRGTFEKLSWEHLAQRLGTASATGAPAEVLVSYRVSKQDFAEALARRLGQEGPVPFFDKWDVKAGDSIPGKIEEAFGRSIACIIVLSNDFTLGQWATAEMETAVTKRIQEGYKVIPILYEKCNVPELLKPLRHVDFSDHDPQTFENKFAELIDAIYGLELNPFRS